MALLFTGMFLPPNLTEYLANNLFQGNKVGGILVVLVILAFIIFATSGLWSVLLGPDIFEQTSDLIVTVVVIILLAVPIIFITWGGAEKAQPEIEKPKEGGG